MYASVETPAVAPLARRGSRRGAWALAASACAATLAVAALSARGGARAAPGAALGASSSSAAAAAAASAASAASASRHNVTQPTGAFAPFEVHVDLRQYKEVQQWLKKKGIVDWSTSGEVLQWVPESVVVRMWPSRVQGDIGPDAEGGYVAFNIASNSRGHLFFEASFLLVMSLRGEVAAVKVLEQSEPGSGVLHFNALKLRDPEHLLLAGNQNAMDESGAAYLYAWKDDHFTTLCAGSYGPLASAHDIQWEAAPNDDDAAAAAVWRPESNGFVLQDTRTGEYVLEVLLAKQVLADVNHLQVLSDEEYAIVNSRSTNSFAKLSKADGTVSWICGGENGMFSLVEADGTELPQGWTKFFGQHNTEYFGEGEYMMFDNNLNVTASGAKERFVGGAPSRLLVLRLDEDSMVAYVEWELELADHSCVYGDNDRLPSGNLLATSWPLVKPAGDDAFQYDARLFETVRATKETAWEAFVVGQRCEDPADGSGGCVRSADCGVPNGWSMYSAERFYEAPLVHHISCDAGVLSFTAHNNFKQNGKKPGYFEVFAHGASGATASALLEQDFTFNPHWRDTTVSADLSALADASGHFAGVLVVKNEWGDRTAKAFSCTASDDDDAAAPSAR